MPGGRRGHVRDMGQWGRPRHRAIAHNQRVRGGGTWAEQDRRLKRHLHGRIWRKRGFAQTWSSQVRKLDRAPAGRFDKLAGRIVLAGVAVTALSIGGRVLILAAAVTVAVMGWRKFRGLWR